MLHERPHLNSQLFCRRRSVSGKRHTTQCQNHFRKYRLIDRETSDGKGGSVWRMCVAHSLHIRTLAIDQKMHGELTRSAPIIERFAVEICNRNQVLSHATFARHRWRGENAIVV